MGGIAAVNIAKWNGTTWSVLGTGTNAQVHVLAAQGGYLYAGGDFSAVGDGSKVMNFFGRYTLTPTLTLLSPTSGPVGTSLTITGTNLTAATSVSFNGTTVASASFTSSSATSIVLNVPTGATTGLVTVTTPSGTSNGLLFTVTTVTATLAGAAPAVLRLYPNPAHGTATVQLPAGTPATTLVLCDALGCTRRRYPVAAGATEATLDVRGLAPGVYVLRGAGSTGQKLLVE
ncbi:T9SS type A sorting domain-containing protein [Hymenobacter sp. BRD67]|uniref:T9SS type A sorting domain-containing protein n=1 Tax=Hymenobacter sp. BRD67 TaxID=2675877 RepID=UPI001C27EA03|nr:T9SS type A sorting domain-containing protein [Hymenobacter sp. BRD67]